jgi:hypothetical protein
MAMVCGPSRRRRFVRVRAEAAKILRDGGCVLGEIAALFGRSDHTSALYWLGMLPRQNPFHLPKGKINLKGIKWPKQLTAASNRAGSSTGL